MPKGKFSMLSSKHMKILFIFLGIFIVSGIMLGVALFLYRPLVSPAPPLTEPTTGFPVQGPMAEPSQVSWIAGVGAIGSLIGSVGSVVSALVTVTAVRKARK